MGDMADFIVQTGMDHALHEYGGIYTTSCRYCGKAGLHWKQVVHGDGVTRWRLCYKGGAIHECDEYRESKGVKRVLP